MSFSKNFLWGAATASTQIEGAFDKDGKGLTIWDVLGRSSHGETCHDACDHYNRYREDVALAKKIGLNSYRFSISWARIFPDNSGKINQKGLDFYSNLIDQLKKNGIEPLITLFHWDLPMWVYDIGGYESPKFPELFNEYTTVVVKAFSDRVKYWMTFNEPQCFIGGGFESGWNAPYRHEKREVIEVMTRNVMLAHGLAVKTLRANAKLKPIIGFAPAINIYLPKDNSEKEIKEKIDLTLYKEQNSERLGWWTEPIVGGNNKNMEFLSDEDMKIIYQPLDFFGFNIYQPNNFEDFYTIGQAKSALSWAIVPECMYFAIKLVYERYKLPVMITENGFANWEVKTDDNRVHDPMREYYLKNMLKQVKRAIDDGIPVIGYQYWSLLDNFEWSIGYDARFGLIYVDYKTQERTIKDSAYYYKKVIKSNGKKL